MQRELRALNTLVVDLKGVNLTAARSAIRARRGDIQRDQPRFLLQQPLPDTCVGAAIPMWGGEVVTRSISSVGARDTLFASTGQKKVCIIDSGIDATHPEFSGVSLTGEPAGWDSDTCGHGTHVAGVIAAVGGNGEGMTGINPSGMSLHVIKVADGAGCSYTYASSVADAALSCRDAGANVIAISAGGPSSSDVERDAFQFLADSGVLVFAAAGNAGNSSLYYPASYTSVVSVAAHDSIGRKATFSNFNSQVDISAPGVGVWSTYKAPGTIIGEVTVLDTPSAVPVPAAAMRLTVLGTVTQQLHECADFGKLSTPCTGGRGKICLVKRGGSVTFYDKAKNCQNNGGVGVIIYDDAPGDIYTAWTLARSFSETSVDITIPVVGVPSCTYDAFLRHALMSYVPVRVSTEGWARYAALSGTSMANAHAAGAAALLWGQFEKHGANASVVSEALLA